MATIELRPEFQHTETGAGYVNTNATALTELNDEVDAWPADAASAKLKTLAVAWLGTLSDVDKLHWTIADAVQKTFMDQAPAIDQRVALAKSSLDPTGWGMTASYEAGMASAGNKAMGAALREIVSNVLSRKMSKADAVANGAAQAGRDFDKGIRAAHLEADDVPDADIKMLATCMDYESRAMASGDPCGWIADKIAGYLEQGSTKRLALACAVGERVALKTLDIKQPRAKKASASHYTRRLYELDPVEVSANRLLALIKSVRDDVKPASIDAASSVLKRGKALFFALCGRDPRAIDLDRALWVDGSRRETDPFAPLPSETWMKRFVPTASTFNLPAGWGPPGWSPIVAKLSVGGRARKPAPGAR